MEQKQLAHSANSRLVCLLLRRGGYLQVNLSTFAILLWLPLPQCQ